MDRDELQLRTKEFSLRVLRVAAALPRSPVGYALANQVVRSGTSVAANYRAVRRARSRKEFVAKLGVVVEEADETHCWLEMIRDAELIPKKKLQSLIEEAEVLLRVFSATRHTSLTRITKNASTKSPDRHFAKSPNHSENPS